MPRLALMAVQVLLVAASAMAQPVPDPKAILSKADAALGAATTLTFAGEARGWGAFAVSEPLLRGQVVIDGFKVGKPEQWRLKAVAARATEDPALSGRLEVFSDVDGAFIYNYNDREIVEGRAADLPGMLDIAGRELLWWIIDWKEAIGPAISGGAAKATWEGQRSVAGEFCDVIRVDSSALDDAATDTWWFISVTDRLPRRVERLVQTDRGAGIMSLEITDLKASDPVDPGAFRQTNLFKFPRSDYKPDATGPRYKGRSRAALPAGALSPDFKLMTPTGQERQLSDLRGRVVVLAFWTSWSKPSVEMLKKLKPMHERLKDKPVTFWALSSGDHGDPVAVFGELKLPFEMLPSADAVARRFGVQDLPAMVVIGPDGRAIATISGGGDADVKAAGEAVEKGLAGTPK